MFRDEVRNEEKMFSQSEYIKKKNLIYLGDFLTVSVPLSLAIEDRFIVEWE